MSFSIRTRALQAVVLFGAIVIAATAADRPGVRAACNPQISVRLRRSSL
jgi:hypothetical protein